MSRRKDFVVFFDSKKDSKEELTRRILYSVFVRRIKANKPLVAAVIAKSGEGKSWGINRLFEVLMEVQGVSKDSVLDFFKVATISNPLQYSEKMDILFNDKNYKKLNVAIVHEAKMLINSANWQSFSNMAIADVNSMSRSLKPIMFFYLSQFIKDIDPKVRPTITHYITFERPLRGKSKMKIEIVWNDERDIEKPKLRKRQLSGYIVDEKGNYTRFSPSYFEMNKPSDDITDLFEKIDFEGKSMIIKKRLSKIIDSIKAELGDTSDRVETLVEYYSTNIELIHTIAKRFRGNWRIKKETRDLHDLNREESRIFERRMNEVLKEKSMILEEQINEGE